jgi:hypothetical protein
LNHLTSQTVEEVQTLNEIVTSKIPLPSKRTGISLSKIAILVIDLNDALDN